MVTADIVRRHLLQLALDDLPDFLLERHARHEVGDEGFDGRVERGRYRARPARRIAVAARHSSLSARGPQARRPRRSAVHRRTGAAGRARQILQRRRKASYQPCSCAIPSGPPRRRVATGHPWYRYQTALVCRITRHLNSAVTGAVAMRSCTLSRSALPMRSVGTLTTVGATAFGLEDMRYSQRGADARAREPHSCQSPERRRGPAELLRRRVSCRGLLRTHTYDD